MKKRALYTNIVTNILAFIRQNLLASLIIAGFALALMRLSWLYMRVEADDGQWQQFKTAHHCLMQSGVQGRQGWQCDDGQIYYSWRQQR